MAEQAFSFPRAVFFAVDSMSSRRASEAALLRKRMEREPRYLRLLWASTTNDQEILRLDRVMLDRAYDVVQSMIIYYIALQNLCLLKLIQSLSFFLMPFLVMFSVGES